MNRRFLKPRAIRTWAVVAFYTVQEPALRRFLNMLCTNLSQLGKYEITGGCWASLMADSYVQVSVCASGGTL